LNWIASLINATAGLREAEFEVASPDATI